MTVAFTRSSVVNTAPRPLPYTARFAKASRSSATGTMADAAGPEMRKRAQFVGFQGPGGKPVPVRHDLRLDVVPRWTGADTFETGARANA